MTTTSASISSASNQIESASSDVSNGRLPPEIILQVLDHITDKPTLARLCLTCKGLEPYVSAKLYHTISLTTPRDIIAFYTQTPAVKKGLVKQLALCLEPPHLWTHDPSRQWPPGHERLRPAPDPRGFFNPSEVRVVYCWHPPPPDDDTTLAGATTRNIHPRGGGLEGWLEGEHWRQVIDYSTILRIWLPRMATVAGSSRMTINYLPCAHHGPSIFLRYLISGCLLVAKDWSRLRHLDILPLPLEQWYSVVIEDWDGCPDLMEISAVMSNCSQSSITYMLDTVVSFSQHRRHLIHQQQEPGSVQWRFKVFTDQSTPPRAIRSPTQSIDLSHGTEYLCRLDIYQGPAGVDWQHNDVWQDL